MQYVRRGIDLQDDVGDLLKQNRDEGRETNRQLKALGEDPTVRNVFARLAG